MSNPYDADSPQQKSHRKFWLGFVVGSICWLAFCVGGLFAMWLAIALLAFGSG